MCNHESVSLREATRIPTPVIWGSPHSLVVWFGFPILGDVPSLRKPTADHRNFSNFRISSINPRQSFGDCWPPIIINFHFFFALNFNSSCCLHRWLLVEINHNKKLKDKTITEMFIVYLWKWVQSWLYSAQKKNFTGVWCFQLNFSLGQVAKILKIILNATTVGNLRELKKTTMATATTMSLNKKT